MSFLIIVGIVWSLPFPWTIFRVVCFIEIAASLFLLVWLPFFLLVTFSLVVFIFGFLVVDLIVIVSIGFLFSYFYLLVLIFFFLLIRGFGVQLAGKSLKKRLNSVQDKHVSSTYVSTFSLFNGSSGGDT